MCARAVANMAGGQLIIVDHKCELNDEAKQGAAHAQSVLREARQYRNLSDFSASEGEGLRIGLSGKDFRLAPTEGFRSALETLRDQPIASGPVYFFFGPEDDGLSPEEMALCHHVCKLPTFGEITSLNLSHAVLLTLYIWKDAWRGTWPEDSPVNSTEKQPEKPEPVFYPGELINQWLNSLGFDLTKERINMATKLNRIFLSNHPSPDDLRLLNNVLHQTVRKLRSRSTL